MTRGKRLSDRPSSFMECHESETPWTDDLPVCKFTGVGFSTNQIYRENGHKQEEHSFEDKSFHLCLNDSTYLYGIFDGHEGVQAATFALQRLAAELSFGQLTGKSTDEEIKEVLRQAFVTVEKSYLESLDAKVAKRTLLQDQLPSDMNSYEQYRKFPEIMKEMEHLTMELRCGTTAVVALVVGDRLYVANVGDSRALLCRTDDKGVLRVSQLSVDHDLSNEDEILRLQTLGLKLNSDNPSRLGGQDYTRCLGNYLVKGGYRELEELAAASEEPIISEPEITNGILIDESCKFLLLMSDGLYRSLEAATRTNQVNKDIAQMAVAEFREQSTLTGVAQAVVDRVVRLHHDTFMSEAGLGAQARRDDITLLVRNLNYNLPRSPQPLFRQPVYLPSSSETLKTEETSSTSESPTIAATMSQELIEPYVDFSEFYRNVEAARQLGTLPPILADCFPPV